MVIVTACASRRLMELNPSSRCQRARVSWPTARSTSGIRAIARSCSRTRSELTRPVRRPVAVHADDAPAVSCWTPPCDTHRATTNSRDAHTARGTASAHQRWRVGQVSGWGCLLYTSDAADEEDSVDLGGRRIIK